jgi:hypothetical protein
MFILLSYFVLQSDTNIKLSSNFGVSFTDILSGLPTKVNTVDISANGQIIYANVYQDGVYRTEGRTVPVELISFNANVSNTVTIQWRRDGLSPNTVYNNAGTMQDWSHRTLLIME